MIQETKIKGLHQLKLDIMKQYSLYSLLRKDCGGGGLVIGVLKDLPSTWIAEGDDQIECIVIEVWIEGFPVRVLNGYGPQESDDSDRKRGYWDFVEREVQKAKIADAGIIIQMDSNCHFGPDLIKNDVNPQN